MKVKDTDSAANAPLASDPVASEPGKVKADKAKADGEAPVAKPGRMRVFRNGAKNVVRVTKDLRTGAIYDHVEYARTVVDRVTKAKSTVKLQRKLRRPGTGAATASHIVELEE